MEEALEADRGGADIIDVKNLQEALVGSGHPDLVEAVRERIPEEKHVSVTLGVVPNQAGTVAMAVRAAGMLDATSVILAHNHPSGRPAPSARDVDLTRDIAATGEALGVALHDHLVIAGEGFVSMNREGLLRA